MSYYDTLGVSDNASQDEIKQAYRKLAAKHHPDKGGDTAKFQEISRAYDTLSDQNKRAQYDAERSGGWSQGVHYNDPNGMHFNFNDLGQMFGFNFGQGFRQHHQPRQQNRDINVRANITLKQSYTGASMEAKYRLPSGKEQTVEVNIPAGIMDGQTIRYEGLGDDSIAGIPKGNLNIVISVTPDNEYVRHNFDVYSKVTISAIEAMIGCTRQITCLDDSVLEVKIRAGTSHGLEYAIAGKGFKDPRSGRTGRHMLVVEIAVPMVLDDEMINTLKEIDAKLNKAP